MSRRVPARAVVFDVQRFCVHDGPGIRTVVFFKGCGLACAWCHNPEAAEPRPQLLVHPARCLTGCSACVPVCGPAALRVVEDADPRIRVDFSRCTDCGDCGPACPTGALELLGREREAAELTAELLVDRPFFESSGGGVTLSGGEPLLHPALLAELLPRLRTAGVHVAVETSGQWAWSSVSRLLPQVDLVLFDLKLADPAAHARWTGHDNRRILDNLHRIAAFGVPLELRTPVVPGVNTTPEAVAGLAALVRELGHRHLRLLPYNPLWEAKLRQVRTSKRPLGFVPLEPADRAALVSAYAAEGVDAQLS